MFGQKFSFVLSRHFVIDRLVTEVKRKNIKLPYYFDTYINLKHLFIFIAKNKKQILNMQKLKKKLMRQNLEDAITKCSQMADLLNIKYKEM